jgi:hypothetical protein
MVSVNVAVGVPQNTGPTAVTVTTPATEDNFSSTGPISARWARMA